jgi:flagellar basal-body rod protein FlgF
MKTDGIASAASALRYWERRQEVASNNLANASTTGFKAERIFARLMGESLPVPDGMTDLREGEISATGNPLDLALHGDSFFVVGTPQGERFTRGGSFGVDARGFLVDGDGNQALGEKGPSRTSVALASRDVRQGHLEGSNVNTISSLVDLISIQRNFANAQKVLSQLDGVRSTIVNDLAKVPA